MLQCGLELHPEKTKIVYCKDDKRQGRLSRARSLTFLGFTFRPRRAKNREGKFFVGFNPAISNEAIKIDPQNHEELEIASAHGQILEELAQMCQSQSLRGWINYYGSFYKSALYPIFKHLNNILVRWAITEIQKIEGA